MNRRRRMAGAKWRLLVHEMPATGSEVYPKSHHVAHDAAFGGHELRDRHGKSSTTTFIEGECVDGFWRTVYRDRGICPICTRDGLARLIGANGLPYERH